MSRRDGAVTFRAPAPPGKLRAWAKARRRRATEIGG
jgi:hypothetical protein